MSSLLAHSDVVPAFEQALRRLQAECGKYFGSARIDFQPIPSGHEHSPRVLRVQVRNGAPLCDVFIKTFVPPNGDAESRRVAQERLLREYEALVRLNDAVSGHPDMRVSRPVACF